MASAERQTGGRSLGFSSCLSIQWANVTTAKKAAFIPGLMYTFMKDEKATVREAKNFIVSWMGHYPEKKMGPGKGITPPVLYIVEAWTVRRQNSNMEPEKEQIRQYMLLWSVRTRPSDDQAGPWFWCLNCLSFTTHEHWIFIWWK